MRRIAPDKWKHFYIGILMGLFLQALGCWLAPGHFLGSVLVVFSIVVIISYGFELYSKFSGHGHYEVMDAVAAIIGGLLGMGAVAGIWWWR